MGLLDKVPLWGEKAISASILAVIIAVGIAMASYDASEVGDATNVNSGDTAWMLVSCAMVLLMTPGLAFFYGGMVRHKNVLSTIMLSVVCMGVISFLWIIVGFSLAFGENVKGGLLGNPKTYGLWKNIGGTPIPALAGTIPSSVYAMFQLMFAIITPALISGSIVERIRFTGFVIFICFWHIIVYCPLAHMVWYPNGLLSKFGLLDFAGGTVVHMSSGYAALVGSLYLGPRVDRESVEPANIAHIILGTALLWFGWFGFNAGSAVSAGVLAGHAFQTTNTAAAVAMLTWMLCDRIRGLKFRASGACCGVVVGLVGITPACGFVTVGGAVVIGAVTAAVCSAAQAILHRYSRLDDTLDAFAAHGVGGTCGMILTSLFATDQAFGPGIHAAPKVGVGLFYGDSTLFWHTIVALPILLTWMCVGAGICYFLADKIVSLRAPPEEEYAGLDWSAHHEPGVIDYSSHGGNMLNGSTQDARKNGAMADVNVA